MKSAVVLPKMVRGWTCRDCGDYTERVNGGWRHVTTGAYPDLHSVDPIPVSEGECYCDKVGYVDWGRALSDNPGPITKREKVAQCICHQRCYVPAVCAACGPNGCRGSVTRVEAQQMVAEAINDALDRAGAKDLEVDPSDIMAGVHGPRVRKKVRH